MTKINPTGNALVYSTYLGGSVSDIGRGIAVDVNGNAYVTGETNSPNFPHYFGQTLNGGTDAFVSKISPSGSLVFSSLLGGTNDDVGRGISLLWGDYPLVAGVTKSGDFPLQKADKSYGGAVTPLLPYSTMAAIPFCTPRTWEEAAMTGPSV